MKVLIIEDEKITRITLSNILKNEGYEVESTDRGDNGFELVKENQYDVVVTDLRLPGKGGIEILKAAKEHNKGCEVIVITAYASVDSAVSALKKGAYDYITKPLTPEKFLSLMKNIHQYHEVKGENQKLKKKLQRFENKSVIGNSPAMQKMLETVLNVAEHDYTVLLEGESGTGKEVIAKALHQHSNRTEKPFVAINCATVPESLIESELFGHEKGSFSGAINQHIGYFERAHEGTIFIDDIDDFPLHLQVKLLRVLQEKQIVRVGGSETITVDVRVICATKVDLEELMLQNKFREDLYYRLNIIPITIPPLRERKEDIPALIQHFLEKRGAENLLEHIDPQFYNNLMKFDWPGNVRQLENTVERFIATNDTQVSLDIIGQSSPSQKSVQNEHSKELNSSFPPFDEFIRNKEEQIINWALAETNYNISKAAKLLVLPRGTLRSKMKKLDLKE